MTPYRLHYAPDNASLIIRLALEEMGLPYETVLVDRAAHAQSSPEYLALNPAGLIPVLETPQGPISETGAILLWLADMHSALAPAIDARTRGVFLSKFLFVANTVHPALRMMFYPDKYVGNAASDQTALRKTQQGALLRHFAVIEAAINDGPFCFGAKHPSILDLYIGPLIRWCALYPRATDNSWFDLNRLPKLHRMALTLETRASVHAAQVAEGLGPTPFTAPIAPNPPEGTAL